MVDFGRAGAASLWKSHPLFSTGTKEAELMLEELRLNPRSPAARFRAGCPGPSAAADDRKVNPRFSTGFAGWAPPRSTTGGDRIHRKRPGSAEREEVEG